MFSELQLARTLWRHGLARAAAARRGRGADRDLGASAIEWAVISAILVTAAVVIGGVVYNVVSTKATTISNCNTTIGATGC